MKVNQPPLAQANEAFRKKDYDNALRLYLAAQKLYPELKAIIDKNIENTRKHIAQGTPKHSDTNTTSIDIVVPVYNALDDVKKCLASLSESTDGFKVNIIVVNDGSDEPTTQWLRDFCKNKSLFTLIENPKNLGYTKTVNVGLKASTADYVITQNSDTIVSEGWLTGLVNCINSNPKIGICGPLANAATWQNVPNLFDDSGEHAVNELPQGFTVAAMVKLVSKASLKLYPRLPFVNGFCFMIKREVLNKIGYMDEENFPIGYGEETDYCIRAQDAGYTLAIADDVYVYHAKSKSFGHKKRKELSANGTAKLKQKHGSEKYNDSLSKVRDTKKLDIIRANIQLMLENSLIDMDRIFNPNPIKKLPITALVITWDVGHNPLGRSYMLAEALTHSVRNVVLTGFQFPRYGDDVWEPVRDESLPVITLRGRNFPEILDDFEHIVKKFKPDVVIACKARLPSVQLGIAFKEKFNIPLIVDVDDHELSFFKNQNPLTIEDIKNIDIEELKKEVEPYSELWTQLTDSLTKTYADEIIVSNVALQREFGGIVVPHVRDEKKFNPELFNKIIQRHKYNIPSNAKVVMFFGTPRAHKGVSLLADAVGKINDKNTILVVVGNAPDKSVTSQLDKLSNGKVIFLPNQPFSLIPEIIVMADLVCLPQDESHAISKYQLPAKAIDAIGMNIPLLVSNTEPLMQLVNDGVAKLINNSDLPQVIENALTKKTSDFESMQLRKRFLENYSYHSAALKMKAIIKKLQTNKLKDLVGFQDVLFYQKTLFPRLQSPINLSITQNTVDIVVFWKQNDTGLYGRRSDMVIKYLASRDDVRKVIVFDAPISQHALEQMKSTNPLTQAREIYKRTYQKVFGVFDTEKISFNVFVHEPGLDNNTFTNAYFAYISKILKQEKVNSKLSFFWFYPKNFLANDIVNFYKPKKVIVDVVDDHRAWPGISDLEEKKLTEHYKSVLKIADLAFANCQPVIDSMKAFNPNIKLVPNGCEVNPEIIEPKNHQMYEELKNFKGKVIGFVGNLEAKIDIELLEKIALKFTDTLLVLVGSTHANPKVKELNKHSNIRLFGVVPYQNVNAIVSKFHVGIVPHLKMDLTKNMNPLKVFVYLANNVPVVSTDIDNIDINNDLIKVANTHGDFISALENQLQRVYQLNDELTKYVLENSWEARMKVYLENLTFSL